MIAFLDGNVEILEEDAVVLTVGGVGYRVLVPSHVIEKLEQGALCRLYTHQHVREDALALYGFLTDEERRLFLRLQSATGVGPKLGLQILSQLEASQIVRALRFEDVHMLTKVSGVGAKTAQRMVVELKDRLDDLAALFEAHTSPGPGDGAAPAKGGAKKAGKSADVRDALLSLGYTDREVDAALLDAAADLDGLSVSDALRLLLRTLGRS